MPGKPSIHLARWVVPVTRPVMENAGIAVSEGIISAAARKKELLQKFPGTLQIIDHGDAVIMPGLVNAHCHLELSFARGLVPQGLGFEKWLRMVMKLRRGRMEPEDPEILSAALDGLKDLLSEGVFSVGDVGNGRAGEKALLDLGRTRSLCFLSFREIIHPFPRNISLPAVSAPYTQRCGKAALSPHSVYTCSRQALRAIKKWCGRQGLPFSIHCAESPEEVEFVRSGRGPLAEILEERGRDIDKFFKTAPSPVRLLDETGALDPSTICVHCAQVDDKDITLLSDRGCRICLCPGSNEYIGSGTAPLEKIFSAAPSRICLGSDSLASNETLSIFAEMKRIFDMAHGISPELILRAGTINGAEALGLSSHLGSLEPGKKASFLVLRGAPSARKEIHEYICCKPEAFPVKLVGG